MQYAEIVLKRSFFTKTRRRALKTSPKCPKCGFQARTPFSECPSCGVIVAKFHKRSEEERAAGADGKDGENQDLQALSQATALMIRQNKEWGEILTGFETKNRYEVIGRQNSTVLDAHESGGSAMEAITRLFLKSLRPFKMNLFSTDGVALFQLRRPFRFYFHELEVRNSTGAPLGTIKRKFSILRRIYSVLDRSGRELFTLFGPLLHPWTFHIKQGDRQVGKITKKWSGLAKESFTDADNFGIEFPDGIGLSQKAILLGAVFLIDFVHFENKQ